jgi:hypothetical protein
MYCKKCGREEFEDEEKTFKNINKVFTVLTFGIGLVYAIKKLKEKDDEIK